MKVNEEQDPQGVADESPFLAPEWCSYCETEHIPDDGTCAETRLRRRRAVMSDYDKKLEEWLS